MAAPSDPPVKKHRVRGFFRAIGSVFRSKRSKDAASSADLRRRRTTGDVTVASEASPTADVRSASLAQVEVLVASQPKAKRQKLTRDDSIESTDSPMPSPSDEYVPGRFEFLFFGGSEIDSTFKPKEEAQEQEKPQIKYESIRPTLDPHMPKFVTPPTSSETLRMSLVLTDPREYDL